MEGDLFKKSWKDKKKTGDAKGGKKGPKQKSQPEGRTRDKKNVHHKEKEKQNKENKVKNGEKR